jgi:hypothetical protein
MDWQRLGTEIVRYLFSDDDFRAITRARENQNVQLLYEADGSWGGATLVRFSIAELQGACLWNTESNSRDLQAPAQGENIYGTFQLGLLYDPELPESPCWHAIQNSGPRYHSDWSWWSGVNRCLFDWCCNDAWMFHIAGTILPGIVPAPRVMEPSSSLRRRVENLTSLLGQPQGAARPSSRDRYRGLDGRAPLSTGPASGDSDFQYDLAISFAGEQRTLARSLARRLDAAGYSVFFDEFAEAELWGRDLTMSLKEVYAHAARFCLILLSREYVEKPWTNAERQNALSRFIRSKPGYILCLKLDESDLPGFPDVVAYVDFRQRTENDVFALLIKKLGSPRSHMVGLSQNDCRFGGEVIRACYRRAIFTRMDSEIDLRAMYDSIREAIGRIQRLIPQIFDQSLQYTCLQIVSELDRIERVQVRSDAWVSNHLPKELRQEIDSAKLSVIRLLLEIRRATSIPIQLPLSLSVDHFFRKEEADEQPGIDMLD